MLAYAAHRRPVRQLKPSTLLLIIGGHALAVAAVMAIRTEMAPPPKIIHTVIHNVPLDPDPPPETEPVPKAEHKPTISNLTSPSTTVVLPMPGGPITVPLGPTPFSVEVGPSTEPGLPYVVPLPQPKIVPDPSPVLTRTAPRLLTPADRMRPPYPESKRRMEQEGTLRLRLAIDSEGRVTAVEPVGAADPEFLAAAQSHLIRAWRYAPAKEGSAAVATSLVITLRFQLEE